jgi:hypothetical protein
MSQAADFFVSYTGADRAWAEWIAWQLEAEGYTVVVRAWDFTPGHDWAHEMQHATSTAERVMAVLSATYIHPGHGERSGGPSTPRTPAGARAAAPGARGRRRPNGASQDQDLCGPSEPRCRQRYWPPPVGPVASRPRRQSFQAGPSTQSVAQPRHPGFPASWRRTGMCRSTPTPTSAAATRWALGDLDGARHLHEQALADAGGC